MEIDEQRIKQLDDELDYWKKEFNSNQRLQLANKQDKGLEELIELTNNGRKPKWTPKMSLLMVRKAANKNQASDAQLAQVQETFRASDSSHPTHHHQPSKKYLNSKGHRSTRSETYDALRSLRVPPNTSLTKQERSVVSQLLINDPTVPIAKMFARSQSEAGIAKSIDLGKKSSKCPKLMFDDLKPAKTHRMQRSLDIFNELNPALISEASSNNIAFEEQSTFNHGEKSFKLPPLQASAQQSITDRLQPETLEVMTTSRPKKLRETSLMVLNSNLNVAKPALAKKPRRFPLVQPPNSISVVGSRNPSHDANALLNH